jgi:hypothetical protein
MAVHKLTFDDWEESHFELIAIHTTVEDFRLAFLMNRELPILLKNIPSPSKLNENPIVHHFNRFEFKDQKNDMCWHLIQNKVMVKNENPKNTVLFAEAEESLKPLYLLPEYKKVDFVCKIEGEPYQIETLKICNAIKQIPWVSMAYPIESSKIKSKNHLIFS